jgi:hypothetical protein
MVEKRAKFSRNVALLQNFTGFGINHVTVAAVVMHIN